MTRSGPSAENFGRDPSDEAVVGVDSDEAVVGVDSEIWLSDRPWAALILVPSA